MDVSDTGSVLRSVIWRRLDQPGMEYCELSQRRDGWTLRGHVVLAEEAAPTYFAYVVVCNAAWVTRSASVESRRRGESKTLTLEADDRHRWWIGGHEVSGVRGCVDVDLGFTPATNTIALRRLDLDVGRAAEVTAAWVRPPDLAVLPLAQRYTRASATAYDYESRSGFAARLEIDDLGLVTNYPPIWTRAAAGG